MAKFAIATTRSIVYAYGMGSIVCNVKDIQSIQKRWLEGALGESLRDDQQVFILVVTPNVLPDEATRKEALRGVESILDQAEANASAQGFSAEEADAAVDDAMRHVRRR